MVYREVMVSSVSYDRLGGLLPFVRSILMGTLLVEGLGAALLSIRFAGDFGPVRGIYYGIWHSISAFCNAGFDLMGAHYGEFCSFTAYAADPLVVLTVLLYAVALGALVFLFCAAGHKAGREGISLNWQDRIPLDLYLCIAVSAYCIAMLPAINGNGAPIALEIATLSLSVFCCVGLVLNGDSLHRTWGVAAPQACLMLLLSRCPL